MVTIFQIEAAGLMILVVGYLLDSRLCREQTLGIAVYLTLAALVCTGMIVTG